MSNHFDIIPKRGFWGMINSRMISELKLYDCLKMDGQNCCSLLLGLRNDFYLHQKYLIFLQKKRIKWDIFVLLLYVKSYVCFLGIKSGE